MSERNGGRLWPAPGPPAGLRHGGDPFERPLDRHLAAQRIGFGGACYRALVDELAGWAVTCPRCVAAGHTVTVREAGARGSLTFSACSEGCAAAQVAAAAGELESFWVDGVDSAPLPPLRWTSRGWQVVLSLPDYLELLEAA